MTSGSSYPNNSKSPNKFKRGNFTCRSVDSPSPNKAQNGGGDSDFGSEVEDICPTSPLKSPTKDQLQVLTIKRKNSSTEKKWWDYKKTAKKKQIAKFRSNMPPLSVKSMRSNYSDNRMNSISSFGFKDG